MEWMARALRNPNARISEEAHNPLPPLQIVALLCQAGAPRYARKPHSALFSLRYEQDPREVELRTRRCFSAPINNV